MLDLKKLEGFYLDYTRFTVVAVCLDPSCAWRVIATNRLAAWQIAAEHEALCHPTQDIARRSLRLAKFKARHFQD